MSLHLNPPGTDRLAKTEIDYSFLKAQFLMCSVSKPYKLDHSSNDGWIIYLCIYSFLKADNIKNSYGAKYMLIYINYETINFVNKRFTKMIQVTA